MLFPDFFNKIKNKNELIWAKKLWIKKNLKKKTQSDGYCQ